MSYTVIEPKEVQILVPRKSFIGAVFPGEKPGKSFYKMSVHVRPTLAFVRTHKNNLLKLEYNKYIFLWDWLVVRQILGYQAEDAITDACLNKFRQLILDALKAQAPDA